MDLSKIISVAGKSGLFRVVAQARQAIIAESLIDGKRVPVPTSMRVSSLKDVLAKLHAQEKGSLSVDPKGDEETLWKKLGEVLPEHDRSRIYPSDVRKLFAWYEQLARSGALDAKEEPKGEDKPAEAKTGEKKGKGPAKADVAVKKANAPKPGAGTKAKSAGTTVRKGSQRGS